MTIGRKMALGSALFLISVISLFAVLTAVGMGRARDEFIRGREDQLAAMAAVKQLKVESHFQECRKDLSALVETIKVLRQDAFSRLEAVQQLKRAQVEQYIDSRLATVRVITEIGAVADAIGRFTIAYNEAYRFDSALFAYQKMVYDPMFQSLIRRHRFADLFLINLSGDIVYAYGGGREQGANVAAAPLVNGPLGKAFRGGMERLVMIDYQPYDLLGGHRAAFIAGPVRKDDDLAGVVAVRLPIQPFNDILMMREGMGETGETLLVGRDPDGAITYRCEMMGPEGRHYFLGRPAPLPYAEAALDGAAVSDVVVDESGRMWIVNAAPLDAEGLGWAFVSRIALKEAIAPRVSGASEDFYQTYIKGSHYGDLFLIQPGGRFLYAAEALELAGAAVGSALLTRGPLPEMVGRVLRENTTVFTDFAPYEPAGGKPAAFLASPLFNGEGVELIVCLRLNMDPIDQIMREGRGAGSSTVTFLAGPDRRIRAGLGPPEAAAARANAAARPETAVRGNAAARPETAARGNAAARPGAPVRANAASGFGATVDSTPVDLALSGGTGAGIFQASGGERVLAAYRPVAAGDATWALVVREPADDALAGASGFRRMFAGFSAIEAISIIAAALLILLVAAGMIATLRRSVVRPLEAVAEMTGRLARYDLTVTVPDTGRRDEMGRLFAMVGAMVSALRELIARAASVAEKVDAAAGRISDSLAHQAAVTTQQATSVSEISSTMEEFSASSTQIAENADAVVAIAEDTLERTRLGVAAVDRVMERMRRVSDDSQRNIEGVVGLRKKAEEITKVMEIINTIADQTKLIAFNAAIEASGAGEAGRRFSVVAAEIRRLADSVMASTSEIESRIADIRSAAENIVVASEKNTQGMESAVAAFSDTGELLHGILSAVQSTVDAARQISLSTQQQKTAAGQVVGALREIDVGIGQTSQSINEVSDIGRDLSELSDTLSDLMRRFTLEKEDRG